MDYVNGDDVTDNRHLPEAIDQTREGSAPPGSAGYDEPDSAGPEVTLRDSAFHVAIEQLEEIQSAPQESQEEIDRVSGRRSIEATAEPDDRVLKFACNWPNTVDVIVIAVQEHSEAFWWVMVSCSPPVSGGEHVELCEKLEGKMLEQGERLGCHEIEKLVDTSLILQGIGAGGHSCRSLHLRV